MSETTSPAPSTRRSVWRNPFVWAFFLGIVTLTLIRPLLKHVPPPPPVVAQVPVFELIDSQGRPFGSEELAGRVYVANFIFTRCGSICPVLTRAMARLAERYEENGVDEIHLVSFSVDPEYDTPEVLRKYGEVHEIDPERWTLLTGDPAEVRRTVVGGFKTAVGEVVPLGEHLVDIAHTGKFILVDRTGGVRGYYDSDEPGLDEIFHRSRHVLDERR